MVLNDLVQLLFPTTCVCCGEVLTSGERQVCLSCLSSLPTTGYSTTHPNLLERRMVASLPLEGVTALYHFRQGGSVRSVVHAMKFHSRTDLCLLMGRQMGLDLVHSGRFDDVDLLVPVPLHWTRRLSRGYNQSELLCRGIAAVFGRRVENKSLIRHRRTRQQSLQHHSNRAENVDGAFRVRHADRLAGRHVLLVDDVFTTGATLRACIDALSAVPGIRVSVATFCVAD